MIVCFVEVFLIDDLLWKYVYVFCNILKGILSVVFMWDVLFDIFIYMIVYLLVIKKYIFGMFI